METAALLKQEFISEKRRISASDREAEERINNKRERELSHLRADIEKRKYKENISNESRRRSFELIIISTREVLF